MLDDPIVKLNNLITRLRKVRVRPENLLLLFPHCLQWSECGENIVHDLGNCKRCGKCRIADLLNVAETLGVPCVVASGGRQALECVKRDEVKAIVAVACEKELAQGIRASLPKPVIGILNLHPHGYCRDTSVEMADVEAALRAFLADV